MPATQRAVGLHAFARAGRLLEELQLEHPHAPCLWLGTASRTTRTAPASQQQEEAWLCFATKP